MTSGCNRVLLGDHVAVLAGNAFKSSRYTQDPIATAVLCPPDIRFGDIDLEGCRRWRREPGDGLDRYLLEPGDVVIGLNRPVVSGGLKWGQIREADTPVLLNQRAVRLRSTSTLTTGYLRCVIGSPQYRSHVANLMSGANMPYISLPDVQGFRFFLPERAVQERVSRAVGAFDDLIENNRRRIEILEEMARLLYREWFVHFRFPGHEDVELVDSELGSIPEGWDVARTSDLMSSGELEIGDGYRAKNAEMTGGPLRFLRVKNVQEGYFADLGDADSFPAEYAEVVGPKRSQPGDIAIAMKGSVGRLARVEETTPAIVYSPQTSYWRVKGPGRLTSTLLYEWMQSSSFVQQCAQVKGATDMADYVNLKDQRSMKLPLPSPELVSRFGDRVDPQLELAANLRQQNGVLREALDLLLPRLVSGELDVSELDLDGALV